MSTITIGATTITPTLIDGYESTRESRNIVHPIIGTASPDVTIRPAMLRRGTLRLLFTTEAAAKTAEDTHANATEPATLVAPEASTVDMTYVVDGRISRALDEATRRAWIVLVDFQEVEP